MLVEIAVLAPDRGPTLPGGQEDPEAELDRGVGAIEDEQSIKVMKRGVFGRIDALDILGHTAEAGGGAHTHHLARTTEERWYEVDPDTGNEERQILSTPHTWDTTEILPARTRQGQRLGYLMMLWDSANVAASTFDGALGSIANNAEAGVRGMFNAVIDGGSEKALNDNLTWAIAHKLNIGSTQHSNEKALLTLLKEKGTVTN